MEVLFGAIGSKRAIRSGWGSRIQLVYMEMGRQNCSMVCPLTVYKYQDDRLIDIPFSVLSHFPILEKSTFRYIDIAVNMVFNPFKVTRSSHKSY